MLRDDVKIALRIQTNLLNNEIDNTIKEAGAELIRSGVPAEVVSAEGALIRRAIITYCQMMLANDKTMAEGYQRSFEYQQDCLRKSTLTVDEDGTEEGDGNV